MALVVLATALSAGAAQAQSDSWGRDGSTWERPAAERTSRDNRTYTMENLQLALQRAGYDPGPLDGQFGPGTRDAIAAFQRDHGMQVTGRPSMGLFAIVQDRAEGTGSRTAGTDRRDDRFADDRPGEDPLGDDRFGRSTGQTGPLEQAEIADLQFALRQEGYRIEVTGEEDSQTRAAIRAFQRDRGLRVTGEPSRRLLAELGVVDERFAGSPDDGYDRNDPVGGDWDEQGRGQAMDDRALIERTEAALEEKGYQVGRVDDRLDRQSRQAIATYQQQRGMEATGEPSAALLRDLETSDVTARQSPEDIAADVIGGIFGNRGSGGQ